MLKRILALFRRKPRALTGVVRPPTMDDARMRLWEGRAERLRERIKSGDAEPLSEREREQLRELRAIHDRRFGRKDTENE